MTRTDHDDFVGWRTPTASPNLKRRALAAARDGSRKPVERRLEDRLWESSAVRYGWLAAASLLMVLNLTVDTPSGPPMVASNPGIEEHRIDETEVGIPIPQPTQHRWTVADTHLLTREMLADPCLDPLTEGDCT